MVQMNNKNRLVVILSHALVLGWMGVIFYMSAQPGDLSGDISGTVSHLFMRIWNAIFGLNWSEVEILQMAEIWDYPIRKLAHMTEFGVLAVLMYWALGQYWIFVEEGKWARGGLRRVMTRYVIAWIFTVVYAATDEMHQLFVPDRSGNIVDVCVDATGAFLALLAIWGMAHVIKAYKRKMMRRKN